LIGLYCKNAIIAYRTHRSISIPFENRHGFTDKEKRVQKSAKNILQFYILMKALLHNEIFFAIFLKFFEKPLDIVSFFPYNSRPQTLIGLELRLRV
jgi:hypothetical protein